MQRHLSPWREMREGRTTDRRIQHAQFVVMLPFVLAVVGLGVFGTVLIFSLGETRTPILWGTVLASGSITATYGVAAWLIGRRRAAGGYIAILLFGWTIAQSLLRRQIGIGTIYSIVAIAVIVRAADELNLKRRPPAR